VDLSFSALQETSECQNELELCRKRQVEDRGFMKAVQEGPLISGQLHIEHSDSPVPSSPPLQPLMKPFSPTHGKKMAAGGGEHLRGALHRESWMSTGP